MNDIDEAAIKLVELLQAEIKRFPRQQLQIGDGPKEHMFALCNFMINGNNLQAEQICGIILNGLLNEFLIRDTWEDMPPDADDEEIDRQADFVDYDILSLERFVDIQFLNTFGGTPENPFVLTEDEVIKACGGGLMVGFFGMVDRQLMRVCLHYPNLVTACTNAIDDMQQHEAYKNN